MHDTITKILTALAAVLMFVVIVADVIRSIH